MEISDWIIAGASVVIAIYAWRNYKVAKLMERISLKIVRQLGVKFILFSTAYLLAYPRITKIFALCIYDN